MPVERSQGRRRPLVPRSDEVAVGVPAASGPVDRAKAETLAQVKRAEGGRLADADSAAALGRLGGLARGRKERALAEMPKLVQELGLRDVAAEALLPYLADAQEFAKAEIARLAEVCGGGECGIGPCSMVQSAALQLAGSRFSFAQGELITGSRLADASRANLMSARDECARAALARPKAKNSVLAAIEAAGDEEPSRG